MGRGEDDLESTGSRTHRALEVVIAGSLLVLCLPVIALTLAISAVSLRANPLFVQERVGRHGRRFKMLKVRTLPTSTPAYAAKHALADHETPAACSLLRRLHLDELPQLASVVLGHMSLVGPRPEMPPMHDAMAERFSHARTALRPGCTGLWQISQASKGMIHESPEYDEYYLKYRSIRLDLWILCRTALMMLGGKRRIDLDAVPSWACATRVSAETTGLVTN